MENRKYRIVEERYQCGSEFIPQYKRNTTSKCPWKNFIGQRLNSELSIESFDNIEDARERIEEDMNFQNILNRSKVIETIIHKF